MLRSNAKQIEKRKHLGGEEGSARRIVGPMFRGVLSFSELPLRYILCIRKHAENVWIRRLCNKADIQQL